ncbi:hypothetical protein C6380_02385, partial [Pseudomonas syringae pv. actinidiae]
MRDRAGLCASKRSVAPLVHRCNATVCGSELAHEEAGANTENLLISQSAFASKLAPTEAGANIENLLSSQSAFASKLA